MTTSVVGDRLRRLREIAGLDRTELSALAGLARPHVGMIERGIVKSPSGATTTALAKALGCSLDWLLNGEGPHPTKEQVIEAVKRSRTHSEEAA